MGSDPSGKKTRPCPRCGKLVPDYATKCKYCDTRLDPPDSRRVEAGPALPGAPHTLLVVLRDREAPGDPSVFCNQVARSLFPEYLGQGVTAMHLEVDRNMPLRFDGADPSSYPYAMMRLMAVMDSAGMGKLELGVRHNLAWSNFDDGYGGRGIAYLVMPWASA